MRPADGSGDLHLENVVATFADLSQIYDAGMALESAGIDGAGIRVFGEGPERTAAIAQTHVAVVDVQSVWQVVPRVTADTSPDVRRVFSPRLRDRVVRPTGGIATIALARAQDRKSSS